jgi:hypothetical protein
MPDRSETGPTLGLVQDVYETVLRAFVEDGTLEIEGKTPAEITAEFLSILRSRMGANLDIDLDIDSIIDHRENLLAHAKAQVDAGNNWIAVTLYATLVEHLVNAIITRALERKGHDSAVIIPLVRELRLRTKISALWAIAGLPAINEDHRKLLDQLIEFRNSFVHYKWIAYEMDIQQSRERLLEDIVKRSEGLVLGPPFDTVDSFLE